MTRCPSQDWDRYCQDNEPPEVCPTCGGENVDEEGDWICEEAPGFCSSECEEIYLARQALQAQAEAEDQAEAEAYAKEDLDPDLIQTATEKAQELNRKCGLHLVEDAAYWSEVGVETASDLERYLSVEGYVEAYKDYYGVSPTTDLRGLSTEQIQAMTRDLYDSQEQD